MKVKSFKDYLEKRLAPEEIAEIEEAARVEYETFVMLQKDIATTISNFMTENNIGFNELVRKLGKSPTQVSRIMKGEANLTLATVAQLFALMGRKAHIVAANEELPFTTNTPPAMKHFP
jgi:cyanate lyase